jgi:molybdopterin biosynthesis enzyme
LFAEADCLVMREIGAPAASAGDTVKIVPLRVSTSLF